MPLLSIIIPCYNSGQYLPEALESVNKYADKSVYEILVVDDGSTDEQTITLLSDLYKAGYNIISQENRGPAAARNTGVKASVGKYLMFLDSDNKILPAYIDKAIEALEQRKDIGVVYSNATFFGVTNKTQFVTQEFDILKILRSNYIDMCSVVRRSVWEQVGGLDENRLLIGHEDWEFWINISSTGSWKFAFLPEALFEYRIREGSLTQQGVHEDIIQKIINYVHQKHWKLFIEYQRYLVKQLDYYNFDRNNPVRSFFKYVRSKYISPTREKRDGVFPWK